MVQYNIRSNGRSAVNGRSCGQRARAAVLLSLLPSSVTLIGAGITVHAFGIGVGAAGGALLIDLARSAFPSASHRRWIVGVTGLGACVCGGALLVA